MVRNLILSTCLTAASMVQAQAEKTAANSYAPLPRPVTSFGAARTDTHIYLFGGHFGEAHKYSKDTTLGSFSRLPLNGGVWEVVSERAPSQGASVVVFDGRVICLGGLAPQNEAGSPDDLKSLATVTSFNAATGEWRDLPSLPEARSSHDAVVLDGKLYVGGGWKMQGREDSSRWAATLDVLDLKKAAGTWRSIPQPFKRRALAATAYKHQIYFIGGMGSGTSREVDVFDPRDEIWRKGPELPKEQMNGFGSAAAVLDGRLYISTFSGAVRRLSADGQTWEDAGKLAQPRFFHRLIPHEGNLLVIGGGSRQGRIAEIEIFTPEKAAAPQAAVVVPVTAKAE